MNLLNVTEKQQNTGLEDKQCYSQECTQIVEIKRMSIPVQLGHFIIPALMMIYSMYIFVPFALNHGLTEYESFIISYTIPMALLFVYAIVIYKYKDNRRSMVGFLKRYRITKLTIKDVGIGIVIYLIAMVGYGLFSIIGKTLIENGLMPLPNNIPNIIDPRIPFSLIGLESMITEPLTGNGMVIWSYSIMLFFNVVGEELFWRGYMLPVQEKTFGKITWLVHGLLWTLFHGFKWWDLAGLLPVCLLIAFIAQKRQSIWPGLIAHMLFNGMLLIMIVLAVI